MSRIVYNHTVNRSLITAAASDVSAQQRAFCCAGIPWALALIEWEPLTWLSIEILRADSGYLDRKRRIHSASAPPANASSGRRLDRRIETLPACTPACLLHSVHSQSPPLPPTLLWILKHILGIASVPPPPPPRPCCSGSREEKHT